MFCTWLGSSHLLVWSLHEIILDDLQVWWGPGITSMGCILLDDRMIGESFVVYTEQTLETPECTTRCWGTEIFWHCSSMKSYLTLCRFGWD